MCEQRAGEGTEQWRRQTAAEARTRRLRRQPPAPSARRRSTASSSGCGRSAHRGGGGSAPASLSAAAAAGARLPLSAAAAAGASGDAAATSGQTCGCRRGGCVDEGEWWTFGPDGAAAHFAQCSAATTQRRNDAQRACVRVPHTRAQDSAHLAGLADHESLALVHLSGGGGATERAGVEKVVGALLALCETGQR